MTKEEKSLLLQDLSARLPYGVICVGVTYDLDDDGERYIPVKVRNILTEINNYTLETASVKLDLISSCKLETIKPYLRPMSSMTEEEKNNLQTLHDIISDENYEDGYSPSAWNAIAGWEDYCNARHLDYRGLIEKGLAHEAPKDMYDIKNK